MSERDLLPYYSFYFSTGSADVSLVAMTCGVCVQVEATLQDLEDAQCMDQTLSQEFAGFLHRMDEEPQVMEDFQDWLMKPCFEYLQLSFQANQHEPQTLQEYFHRETITIHLQNVAGRLEAKSSSPENVTARYWIPRIPASCQTVQHAIKQGALCLSASKLQIMREPNISEWERDTIPQQVQAECLKRSLYFKAAFESDSFERELSVLLRIQDGDPDKHLRTSRLAGLVQWDDDLSIAGLLVEYIPDSKTLDWAADEATRTEHYSSWLHQLQNTLSHLHRLGIVWGDVKPENVLVDTQNNVWMIDFGGGYSPDWIDPGCQGTTDGDLQGLRAIARYLSLEASGSFNIGT